MSIYQLVTLLLKKYYEIQTIVTGLDLPSETIDVCIDNRIIFWKYDENLQDCPFCGKRRYQETIWRNHFSYQSMWHLPVSYRLKRLWLVILTPYNLPRKDVHAKIIVVPKYSSFWSKTFKANTWCIFATS